ncbi:MAG: GDP-mannose 4,6-dehydratase, partial [Candidatus Omnitrophica bacterium]|nr:GDP-mannose 4,6-dehydratase [Candidatus Omnitrophota bacterium]
YGDGQQVRSFTYIDDAIEALGLLEDNEQALGQVFNVGSRESVSIFDLAQKVKDLSSSASEIKLIPYEQAYDAGFEDMRFRVPDITKISDLTGYQPKINLEQMLKSIIDYHGRVAER